MDKSRGESNKRISSKKESRKSSLLQSVGWLRSSFEFRGKASSRKLTVFFCFILLNISFIVHLHTNQLIQIEFIYFYGLINKGSKPPIPDNPDEQNNI